MLAANLTEINWVAHFVVVLLWEWIRELFQSKWGVVVGLALACSVVWTVRLWRNRD
jgi:hypothetical protein